jgi:hypothetical protein
MIKILIKTAIISSLTILTTSIITLYVFYKYLDHCAIEGLQMKLEIIPRHDVNGAGICLDFTDFFVIYFTIIPCLTLCIWAYFFSKRNKNIEEFTTLERVKYWFILIAFVLVAIYGVLICIATLRDLWYFFSIGGYKDCC